MNNRVKSVEAEIANTEEIQPSNIVELRNAYQMNPLNEEYNSGKSARDLDQVKMYAELERRVCTKCTLAKEKKEFSARSTRKSGKTSWCKPCLNEWRNEDKRLNRAKYQAYEFKRGLKRNYGLTVEQYNKILSDQSGVCGCCGCNEDGFKRGFHVDHDHQTGQVRGILCTRCNPGIGYFGHSIEKLEMAIAYLSKFKK